MRGENELQVTTEEVILLHLLDYCQYESRPVVPFTVTQKGIAKTNQLTLSTVSRTLQKLKRLGYADEKFTHVEGKKRRQKTYFLTKEYLPLAKKMKNEMGERKILLRCFDDETREVRVSEINNNLETKLSFLEIIRHTSDGVFDCRTLEKIEGGKEENIPVSPIPLTQKLLLDEHKPIEGLSFQSRFVGRDKELNELKSHLDNAIKGHSRVIFVAGEAGIGKTRLVSELGICAGSQNIRFLMGRCLYQKGAIPYLPFIEALSNYSRVIKLSVDKEKAKVLVTEGRTEIWRGMSIQDEKARVFEKLSQSIIDIANEKPLILFLDDFHWADTASIQLLHYVARNTRQSPISICCAYRLEELTEIDGKPHPLIGTLQRMMKENLCSVIELERLGLSSTKEMIQSCFEEKDLPEDFFKVIYEETEGNPFFIEEVVKSIQEGLNEVGTNEQWIASKIKIPKTVREVIERRVNRLDNITKELLRYASVIGEEFDLDTLLHSMEINENDILDPIDRLLEAKLIYEDRSRDDELYEFNHSLIQEVVYEGLSRARKQLMHKQVAKGLEKIHGHEIDEVVYDIAYHFSKSNNYEKACEYSIRAGDKASNLYALEEALSHYKIALRAIGKLEETTENRQKKVDILTKIGDIKEPMGEWDDALENYINALGYSKEIKNNIKNAELNRKIGIVNERKGEWDRALGYYEVALKELGKNGDQLEEAKIYGCMAHTFFWKGEYDKSIKYYQMDLEVVEKKGHYKETALVYAILAIVYQRKGDLSRAIECCENSLKMRKKIGDSLGFAMSQGQLGIINTAMCDWDKAIEYYEKSLGAFKKIKHARFVATTYNNLGFTWTFKGDWSRARYYCKRGLRMAERIGDIHLRGTCYGNLGTIYMNEGYWDKAMEYFKKSLRIDEKLGDVRGKIISYNNLGSVCRKRGEYNKAIDYLKKSLTLSPKIKSTPELSESYRSLAEVNINTNDTKKALSYCQQSFKLSSDLGDKFGTGKVYRVFGMIYKVEKEWDKATKYFQNSIEILEELNAPYELGNTYFEFALMYKEKANKQESKKYLEMALKLFKKLKAEKDLEKSRKELKEIKDIFH